jgi:hypothetical protein
MANVRIIYDNAAERASNITASTTVTNGLAATSLASNTKSLAHRSTGTTVTYTLSWSTAEQINGIILPATNLSSVATIGAVVNGTTTITTINACPSTTLDNYSGVKNVNSFPYGGLSKTALWFPSTYNVTTLSITLSDSGKTSIGNPAYPGYIDCSRIVCGKYWEPSLGVSKDGLELVIADTTQTSRSDTGDLYADRGTIYDQLNFNLGILTKSDKEELIKILKYTGNYRNIALSVFPEGNNRNEQDYIIYGKRETSGISYLVHNFYSNSFSIIGW